MSEPKAYERWEPVEVMFGGEWIEGRYLMPVDRGLNPDVSPDLVHVVSTFALGISNDQAFADADVRPMPIRRGDVVQCVRDCDADVGTGVMVAKELAVVDEVSPGGRLILFGRPFDPDAFARIGRAKLMPDGTPVDL